MCLLADPGNVCRKNLPAEAVLVNEDVLAPEKYPVRLQVVGPKQTRVLDRTITVQVPERTGSREPPFALPVFAEDVVIDGPSGKYLFLATLEKGAAASGGEAVFTGRSAGNAEGRRHDRNLGTGRRTDQEACGTRRRCLAI